MPGIVSLIDKDLSEPYSVFTYRYFINNWPDLCYMTMQGDRCVGAIICKLDVHRCRRTNRGYIAMLAVEKELRGRRIGSKLVKLCLDRMQQLGADECVLETVPWLCDVEMTLWVGEVGALQWRSVGTSGRLSTGAKGKRHSRSNIKHRSMGFVKEKRLHKSLGAKYNSSYYLNGNDAFRLKFLFKLPDGFSLADTKHESSLHMIQGADAFVNCKTSQLVVQASQSEANRVCGSLNADIIIEISRFPKKGETLGARSEDTGVMVPGGKGANQAVAASRLSAGTPRKAQFICQFGNDSHAVKLEQVLADNKLDLSGCGRAQKPSGQAFIFLEADGSNSILIVGGSNVAWPAEVTDFERQIQGASAVLLQQEIPKYVNEAVAKVAHAAGVPVIQDVGGEEREFSDEHLRRLAYICPNETELERLTGMPTDSEAKVVAAARTLQKRGVKNVLCTLGSDGAVLVTAEGKVLRQASFPVPGGKVVDTTGAGDCFRAAFAVALVEGKPLQECMKFAAAAGALTVSKYGAVPSLPTRAEVTALVG
ncbi:RBSK [Symbiodinium pilosum]|uniref:Ribokinase n=1 Tax=Symbiodinium pilosum TaxID=2952 RepID=A0A812JHB4_SYMPI|nr:RBSK [Symbiodinium pilosum]